MKWRWWPVRRRLAIDDPVFGALSGRLIEYRGDRYICWSAERRFTIDGEDAAIDIFSGEEGPTERQRRLFDELQVRYTELRRTIEGPLAAEYEWIRKNWNLDSLALATPADIWKVAHLVRIELNEEQKRNADLLLGHVIEWEAGHDLNVAITNWHVDEVKLEG